MNPICSFEPVTSETVDSITSALGAIGAMIAGLNDIDISAGAGIIDKNTKCLWTQDGHRIEVWLSADGSYGAAKSKEIDPDKPSNSSICPITF